MSDIKIQTIPAPEGTVDLVAEAAAAEKSVKGFVGSQVFPITGATGVETTVQVNIKQVGHRAFEGSNQSDHRSQAVDAKLPNNPGPREGMTQTPNGKFCRS